jgi:nucleoside-diphosphate-sugar epimerase
MNMLLTGSSGFVGTYFKKRYKDKYSIKTFSFLNNDLKELNLIGIDTVVYLSALVHQMSGTSAEEYEKVNVTQTINLANKAKESAIKHFIFMSTVKVYGEETNNAYKENTVCNPQDEYGMSKLKAEQELQKLEDDDFKISIIRTPIVYGFGVKANIKNLVNLVKKISVLPFGSIDNKRSMVYLGNLCHLIDVVIEKEQSGVFLASDDEAVSTTRFIELIAENLDKKITLVKIPFFKELLKLVKPSFYKRLYESLEVDNSYTKKILKFENLYSLEEGIALMIKGNSDFSKKMK